VSRHGLLGNAAIYTLANAANSAIPLLLLPVLTRLLSPEEYGVLAIFTVLVTAFRALTGLSVHGAVNVRFFDAQIEHPRYVGTALAILAGSTLVVLLFVLLATPWMSEWTQMSQLWLVLAALTSAAQFVIQVRLLMWQVAGQAIRYGVFQVLQTALNLGLSLLLVSVVGMGWEGRAVGISGATFMFAALGMLTLHRTSLVEWRFDRAYARDALRFGLPLVPHVVGSLLIAASDRLMVANMMSVRDVGMYAAGMQIGLIIGMLADSVVKAIGPWLYANLSRNDEVLRRRIVRVTYVFFFGIAVVSLAFGVAAPYMLLLVGEQFRSNQAVVMYVALGSAFGGMYLMVVSYIFYANRNEFLSAASLLIGLFNVVATYFLVGRHGAVGAAQAYAVSQLLMFLLTWYIAARCHPMPWLSAFHRSVKQPTSA